MGLMIFGAGEIQKCWSEQVGVGQVGQVSHFYSPYVCRHEIIRGEGGVQKNSHLTPARELKRGSDLGFQGGSDCFE